MNIFDNWSVVLMQRAEKGTLSRRKIMDAALDELEKKNYDAVSLNAVCANVGLSKGMVYYYFKNKDALYLACVEECYTLLTNYLRPSVDSWEKWNCARPEELLQQYSNERMIFFRQNPRYLRLYCQAENDPPEHLAPAIKQLRKSYSSLSRRIRRFIAGKIKLNGMFTLEEFAELMALFHDLFQSRMRQALRESRLSDDWLMQQEIFFLTVLKAFLYGTLASEARGVSSPAGTRSGAGRRHRKIMK